MAKVGSRIAALAAMKPTALKAEWQRVHGEEPPRIAASLLARALAFDLQCAAQNGAADVKSGKVDVVIVYKVDRLTRGLNDFARIVDVFDAAGASFVSVTQQLDRFSI